MEPESPQDPTTGHHSVPDESNSPPHIQLFKVVSQFILPAMHRSSKMFLPFVCTQMQFSEATFILRDQPIQLSLIGHHDNDVYKLGRCFKLACLSQRKVVTVVAD
jgi:hypothetical protein